MASRGRGNRGADDAARAGGDIFVDHAGRLLRQAQRRDPRGRFAPDPNRRTDVPPWTDADRRREWRRLADDPNSPLTDEERQEIRDRGYRGPTRVNPWTGEEETMELSHEPVARRDGGTNVEPAWPDDHADRDPYRHLPGNRRPYHPLDDP